MIIVFFFAVHLLFQWICVEIKLTLLFHKKKTNTVSDIICYYCEYIVDDIAHVDSINYIKIYKSHSFNMFVLIF